MSSYTKDQPFLATLRENRRLNLPGSAKDTPHFVVDFSGSGLTYTCGDSLGVLPQNNPGAVDELLVAAGLDGSESVILPKREGAVALRDALLSALSLASPSKKALSTFEEKATDPADRERLATLLDKANADACKAYLAEREYIDLFLEFPSVRLSADELVGLLKRLTPRLYSIASAPSVDPEQVHLTVAVVRYETNGRAREGVASTWLADRVPLDVPSVPVYITASHFGLPEDPAVDLIMVGPGTGVAPFRSFLQEHRQRGGTGRTWLFFGDQHETTDFLYRDEFAAMLADGSLTRLDTAFSRDQEEKIYVQQRMREKGAELWRWLEGGASFFICGDASRMARDVDEALHDVIREHGGLSEADAAAYVKELRSAKRYQKDIY